MFSILSKQRFKLISVHENNNFSFLKNKTFILYRYTELSFSTSKLRFGSRPSFCFDSHPVKGAAQVRCSPLAQDDVWAVFNSACLCEVNQS